MFIERFSGTHTHADNGATVVQNDTVTLQAVSALAHDLGDALIEGVAEGNVCNRTTFEVSPWSHTLGTVNNLVGDNKVTGLDFLLQTADGGESNDAANTDGAQSGDVGTGRNLMRSNLMVGAVAAQESNRDNLVIVLAVVVQDGDGRGGFAPGSGDGQGSNLSESRELTQTSATDDGNWDGA
jgi:hypothetical protein